MLLASGGTSGGHWWEHRVEGARSLWRIPSANVPVGMTSLSTAPSTGGAYGTLDHAQARQPLLLAGARSWFALRRAPSGRRERQRCRVRRPGAAVPVIAIPPEPGVPWGPGPGMSEIPRARMHVENVSFAARDQASWAWLIPPGAPPL
jgi:hypothetical protein